MLADVSKTTVYRLADYINRQYEIIPHSIIIRPPSAELKPGQLDQDALPPYDILDAILNLYVEKALSPREITARGYDANTVLWVCRAVLAPVVVCPLPPGRHTESKNIHRGTRGFSVQFSPEQPH